MKPIGAVLSATFPARFPKWHRAVYEHSHGLVGHRWTGFPCLLLVTTGRKSGVARSNVLTYVDLDGDCVIAASNGGSAKPPAWLLNLQTNPQATVRVGRQVGRARGELIPFDSEDYARAWRSLNELRGGRYDEYQRSTGRPIALVRLTPRPSKA
jgi:F420H(2)-dependent quinone reductase